MKLPEWFLNWVIAGYCAAILFLSVAALNSTAALNKTKMAGFRSDYLLHMLLFIPFAMLAYWRWGGENRSKIWFYITLGAGMALAGISEGIQWFLPYRTFNLMDLGANCTGIVAGALIAGLESIVKRKVKGDDRSNWR